MRSLELSGENHLKIARERAEKGDTEAMTYFIPGKDWDG
jgi:hypothetical protein